VVAVVVVVPEVTQRVALARRVWLWAVRTVQPDQARDRAAGVIAAIRQRVQQAQVVQQEREALQVHQELLMQEVMALALGPPVRRRLVARGATEEQVVAVVTAITTLTVREVAVAVAVVMAAAVAVEVRERTTVLAAAVAVEVLLLTQLDLWRVRRSSRQARVPRRAIRVIVIERILPMAELVRLRQLVLPQVRMGL
jgi:hypothetical protein